VPMSKARGCLPHIHGWSGREQAVRLDPGAQTAVQCDSGSDCRTRGRPASQLRATVGDRLLRLAPSCVVGFAFWYLMRSDRALGTSRSSGQHQGRLTRSVPLRRAGSGVASSFRHVRIPARAAFLLAPLAVVPYAVGSAGMFVLSFAAILTASEPWRSAIGAATASRSSQLRPSTPSRSVP